MYANILQAVKELAEIYAEPYTKIEHGAMPMGNSLAIYLGPGMADRRFVNKGGNWQVTIALNGKHTDLSVLLHAMSNIHKYLMLQTSYPQGDGWAIYEIETSSPPSYLSREQSDGNRWLYGSLLTVSFSTGGIKCLN